MCVIIPISYVCFIINPCSSTIFLCFVESIYPMNNRILDDFDCAQINDYSRIGKFTKFCVS